jgi:hypothetical protein
MSKSGDSDVSDKQGFERFMKLLGLFDSFTVSSGTIGADGIVVATVQLIQK